MDPMVQSDSDKIVVILFYPENCVADNVLANLKSATNFF